MAVELETTIKKTMESIARVELFTDASLSPDDWSVVFHFERGNYDADGKIIGPTEFGSMRVQKRFGDIKGDPDVLKAMGIIKAKAYQYREENIARAAEQEAERVAITQQSTVAS